MAGANVIAIDVAVAGGIADLETASQGA